MKKISPHGDELVCTSRNAPRKMDADGKVVTPRRPHTSRKLSSAMLSKPTVQERAHPVNTALVRPVRIQRSRKKGAKLVSPNGLPVVCVTRPGKWGNPYPVGSMLMHDSAQHVLVICTVEDSVAFFRLKLKERLEREPDFLSPLRGKNLACWCGDGPCHADVLLELANADSCVPAKGAE